MVNGPHPEFERDQLLELLNLLERDRDARLEFQQHFGPDGHALDELVWRIDPSAVGPSGATNPMLAARELEVTVHSRPSGDDGEAVIGSAELQLSQLMREAELKSARLDAAIKYLRERPSTAVAPEPPEEPVLPAAIDEPTAPADARRIRWRTVIALAAAAVAGALAATVISSASVALSGGTVGQLPSPAASSPVLAAESQVIVWIPVEGDLMPDVDARRSMEGLLAPDELLAATSLGIRGAWTARGFLSDAGKVCISLSDSNGDAYVCKRYDDFVATGLSVDSGSWSITWRHDGTVVWDGI